MAEIHKERVEAEINRLIQYLKKHQSPDGRWSFCFESGPMTDSYMILLYRIMGYSSSREMRGLISRLRGGHDQGIWKLYPDEKPGSVSATVEAVTALVAAGELDVRESIARKAREFVAEQGGIQQAGSLTKIMLNLIGVYNWSNQPKVPVEFFLLPWWFPISLFDFVGFTRVHVAPILLAAHRQFSAPLPGVSDRLARWWPLGEIKDRRDQTASLRNSVQTLLSSPQIHGKTLKSLALKRGERFILDRIESDGTLYSYFSTTWLMIFSLWALGYPKNHRVVTRAIQGLKSFYYPVDDGFHMQETTSAVWDTSLILATLRESGLPPTDPCIRKGVDYLFRRQHNRFADWSLRNPGVLPGGWGFSNVNTINPDVDDTSASLRAIAGIAATYPKSYRERWYRGCRWLLSMQNKDGGWPAFEKNTDKSWPNKLLPFQDAQTVWTDPSSVDLTGRTMYFIGRELGWKYDHPVVQRGFRFLLTKQETTGAWFGRWGIAYLYGTWAALTGMGAVGVRDHWAVERGVRWLLQVQNKDGGWGESCRSDVEKKYIPLGYSTPSQTAWALDALIPFFDRPTPEIRAGIRFLLESMEKSDWTTTYPTGAGLAGQFYIHYHSYRYIWPLNTLIHYRNRYFTRDKG